MRVINADPERNQWLHFLWARMEMLQGQQAEGDVYVRDLLQWAQNLQGEQAQHQYQILHFVQEMVSRARNEVGEILNQRHYVTYSAEYARIAKYHEGNSRFGGTLEW